MRNVFFCLIFVVIFIAFLSHNQEKNFSPAKRIAHAGGGISNDTYTNSLEALNFNYGKGFRFFEIDFNWTSDGKIVCVHDWDNVFVKYLGFPLPDIPDKQRFIYLIKNFSKYHMLTLEELVDWLIKHPDAIIVTDVKHKNLKALKIISDVLGPNVNRVIPQIYFPNEYQSTRKMGYKNIIWTLYRYSRFDSEVINAVEEMDLFAVTMPLDRVKRWLGKKLKKSGVPSYTHTINSKKEAIRYIQENDITEVYTDFLTPN